MGNYQELLHTIKEKGMLKMSKKDGFVICLVTVAWYAVQVMEVNMISVVASLLFYSYLLLFLWAHAAQSSLVTGIPPTLDEIMISEAKVVSTFKRIRQILLKFYETSQGKDPKLFFMTLGLLAVLPRISCHFSSLTFLYIAFLGWKIYSMFLEDIILEKCKAIPFLARKTD